MAYLTWLQGTCSEMEWKDTTGLEHLNLFSCRCNESQGERVMLFIIYEWSFSQCQLPAPQSIKSLKKVQCRTVHFSSNRQWICDRVGLITRRRRGKLEEVKEKSCWSSCTNWFQNHTLAHNTRTPNQTPSFKVVLQTGYVFPVMHAPHLKVSMKATFKEVLQTTIKLAN